MTEQNLFHKQLKESIHVISTDHMFFTGKLLAMDHHEDDSIPTAHTDGISITYNPEFYDQLSYRSRVTLVAHELGHIIFCHHLRMRGRDAELWNVATDHAINLLLELMGFEPIPNWLCDHKYMGWRAEDIYADLQKKSKDEQDKQKSQSKKSGGSFSEPKNANGEKLTEQEINEKLNEGLNDAQCAKNSIERAIKGIEKSESLKPQEKAKKTKQIGRGFSEIIRELKNIEESRINWEDVVRRFLLDKASSDFSYEEPEQDLMEVTGFFFPTLESQEFGKIGLALDVSGSLHHMAGQVASEAFHTLEELNEKTLDIFYVSNKIHAIDKITDPSEIKQIEGEGTNYNCLFNHFKEEQYEMEGLIFLTDGLVNTKNWVEPDFPVLWILTGKNPHFENNVPFGDVLHFNN